MRCLALSVALTLAGCATSPRPTEPTAKPADEVKITSTGRPKMAPKDEPARTLFSFESPDELRGSKAVNFDLALVGDGATLGEKALKLTVHVQEPENATTHGLRINFAPPQSWADMYEVTVDVTNPEAEAQHFQLSLMDAAHPDKEHRRKGYLMIPPHSTVTDRVALTKSWGPVPMDQRSGMVATTNDVELDLTQIRSLWLLADRSAPGQSLIVDNLRLVKRDAQGVAVTTAPRTHLPKVAVLDLLDVTGELGPRAKLLTTLVYDECSAAKTSEPISSAEILEMLGVEKQKQLLGCTESSCLAEIGGALGTDYLLSSQVGLIGSRLRVDVRLIDARKAKVLSSAGGFVPKGSDDALADAVTHLVRQTLHDSPLARK